ncbi:GMP synthase (glutamine-hydrolyzing) [Vulcanisaeta thermophila]|uniref:GMP synthase (glutamine-hydrolyzing) n=1 Tax=Vulcanisaeta thermophila TaxID=867917 RepID=UPI00085316B0|nr:ATP-binding protein [Vulcanisaeta thermophila]
MDVKAFINQVVEAIKRVPLRCALAAVSGGVDSTTSAVLARLALGDRLRAVFMDTGFMRINEPQSVRDALRDLLPLEIIDLSNEFYSSMMGLADAEEKRLRFRETFYNALSRIARDYGCDYLVQGTIAPDWIETKGGIKTQHNVLEQLGIDTASKYGFKLIEPLRELYKDQVREVARELGIPSLIINRQPFPGPGLSIRAVGRLTLEKLELVRRATAIVEDELSGMGLSQWFAAAWEDDSSFNDDLSRAIRNYGDLEVELFRVRATGVKGDSREYGGIALVRGHVKSWELIYELYDAITTRSNVTHVIYELTRRGRGGYFVSIRAVETQDFMTAEVPRLGRELLMGVAQKLMRYDEVSAVGFDVTPKPPATIEYE